MSDFRKTLFYAHMAARLTLCQPGSLTKGQQFYKK